MYLAQHIAEFVHATRFEDFPKDVVETAKLCVLDSIGVMLYGTQFKAAQILCSYARKVGGKPEATVVGSDLKVPAGLAAMVNAVSAHVADYDDAMKSMQAHPSAVLMPTALALAEALNTSGQLLLTAFIIGMEVGGKLGKVMRWTHYDAGWHGTGTIGTIAAAAAAARVLKLDVRQIANAIGIAASGAAGLRENFGTMTKSYHAAQAANNGIVASELAMRGFTASGTIFEGSCGFFKVFSGSGHLDSLPNEFGAPWSIGGIIFKQYPSCAGTHTAVNAIMDLQKEVEFSIGELDEIECRVRPVISSVLKYPDPQDELEAKFSMPFCVGAALVSGGLGIRQFNAEMIQNRQVREVMKKVRLIPDPEMEKLATEREALAPVKLTLKLSGGKQISKTVVEAYGSPSNPFQRGVLESKFMENTSQLLSKSRAEDAMKNLLQLEAVEKVSVIAQGLRCEARKNI